MNKNDLVVKKNEFIYAKYNLSLEEQRVILILASVIRKDDEDFKTYDFKIKDFLSLMNLNSRTKYEDLPQICLGLLDKSLKMKLPNGDTIGLSFLSYVKHNAKTGTISMRFDKDLKPFLLNIKEAFTSYKLGNVIPLRSKYSIRMYEILKSYQYLGKAILNINELRAMLGINEEEYKKYSHLKSRVLLPTEKEINRCTDIIIEFEEIKANRKVESIKFIIKNKVGLNNKIDEIAFNSIDENRHNIIKVMEIMDNLVGEKDATSIYNKSGKNLDKIRMAYNACKDKDIDNLVGYMISLVSLEEIPKPIKKKKTKKANFEQRNYTKEDFKELERKLLGRDDEDDQNEYEEELELISE